MAKLKIRNFGPIQKGFSENDGFLEISPVTVICGNQATGKSTIAKLYSTCAWLEKKVDSGEFPKKITKTFFKELLAYHKIDCYIKKETEILYIGEACKITYQDSKISISGPPARSPPRALGIGTTPPITGAPTTRAATATQCSLRGLSNPRSLYPCDPLRVA